MVMASMRSMTFLQVDRCSNEPFSTYCVYCVFYRSSFWNIVCIAYFTNWLRLILRILRMLRTLRCVYCFALHCVALRILQQAAFKRPAIFGRVLTIKAMGVSSLIHSASNIDVPVQGRFFNVLLKNKRDKIKKYPFVSRLQRRRTVLGWPSDYN